MRNSLGIILAAALVVGLLGCGSSESTSTEGQSEEAIRIAKRFNALSVEASQVNGSLQGLVAAGGPAARQQGEVLLNRVHTISHEMRGLREEIEDLPPKAKTAGREWIEEHSAFRK